MEIAPARAGPTGVAEGLAERAVVRFENVGLRYGLGPDYDAELHSAAPVTEHLVSVAGAALFVR